MRDRFAGGHHGARVITPLHFAMFATAMLGAAGACRGRTHQPGATSTGAAPTGRATRGDSTSAGSVGNSGGTLARQGARWSFDSAQAGQPPAGFSFGRTGSGRPGRWVVLDEPDAPSASNVLAQEDSDPTDYRFPIAVADAPTLADVSVSVRCKPVTGRVDQACGIVWRYRDENNYYLARANALEDNVNFYYVQNGRRREIKGWKGKVASGTWHALRANMRGDKVEVYFDGAKAIEARDSRFSAPGKVGVWTKADSRTLFDDLTAAPPESP